MANSGLVWLCAVGCCLCGISSVAARRLDCGQTRDGSSVPGGGKRSSWAAPFVARELMMESLAQRRGGVAIVLPLDVDPTQEMKTPVRSLDVGPTQEMETPVLSLEVIPRQGMKKSLSQRRQHVGPTLSLDFDPTQEMKRSAHRRRHRGGWDDLTPEMKSPRMDARAAIPSSVELGDTPNSATINQERIVEFLADRKPADDLVDLIWKLKTTNDRNCFRALIADLDGTAIGSHVGDDLIAALYKLLEIPETALDDKPLRDFLNNDCVSLSVPAIAAVKLTLAKLALEGGSSEVLVSALKKLMTKEKGDDKLLPDQCPAATQLLADVDTSSTSHQYLQQFLTKCRYEHIPLDEYSKKLFEGALESVSESIMMSLYHAAQRPNTVAAVLSLRTVTRRDNIFSRRASDPRFSTDFVKWLVMELCAEILPKADESQKHDAHFVRRVLADHLVVISGDPSHVSGLFGNKDFCRKAVSFSGEVTDQAASAAPRNEDARSQLKGEHMKIPHVAVLQEIVERIVTAVARPT
eukprot:GHVQ01031828.1.p1 GENE.GHVQ01031828.1~~GHVQ01031828.1.p1  ORF type:complete len:523 (+),score=66.51 GHVQ01031828.1:207-1775(+)